jgi:hypothetical protein
MRQVRMCLLLVLLVPAGCSNDGTPPVDTGHAGDSRVPEDTNAMPWPDWPANKDVQAWTCTAGQAGMCNDNKRSYCNAGVCAACPADHVDCDRTGDCECVGACNGTKCAGSK